MCARSRSTSALWGLIWWVSVKRRATIPAGRWVLGARDKEDITSNYYTETREQGVKRDRLPSQSYSLSGVRRLTHMDAQRSGESFSNSNRPELIEQKTDSARRQFFGDTLAEDEHVMCLNVSLKSERLGTHRIRPTTLRCGDPWTPWRISNN